MPQSAGCVDLKAKTRFEKLLQGPRDKIGNLSNQRKDNRPVNSSLWPPFSLCMMSRDSHIFFSCSFVLVTVLLSGFIIIVMMIIITIMVIITDGNNNDTFRKTVFYFLHLHFIVFNFL